MPTIKLQSSDGEEFTVDLEVAKKSETIKTMLEHVNTEDAEEAVPIMKVRGAILEKVIEWSEHHVNDKPQDGPPPVLEGPYTWPLPTDDISEWDMKFVDEMDMGVKFELILAANYLEIQDLMQLTCKSVANEIKGKNAAEMRRIFNVSNSRKVSQSPKRSDE